MLTSHLCDLEGRLMARLDMLRTTTAAEEWPAALHDCLRQEFLDPMFGGELAIDTGEVVDNRSKAGDSRPAFDVVLVQRQGPTLRRPGAPTAFPAESVVATLAVVPVLDEAAVRRAVADARSVKQLQRSGWRPTAAGALREEQPTAAADAALPAIPSHLLGFDCPAPMSQVHIWLKQAHRDTGIVEPDMPDSAEERCAIASPALDGIFALGRGFLNFDNMPWGFASDEFRKAAFGAVWALAEVDRGALYSLYLQLQLAAIAMASLRFDPRPYTTAFPLRSLRLAN